jgi:hypothetical protein
MTLLERSIASIEQRLVVLAPTHHVTFARVDIAGRQRYMREMQTLRGAVYLRRGSVKPHQLSPDGSHRVPEDEDSWHLLLLDTEGAVSACAWYVEYANPVFNDLRVRHVPLGPLFRHAVTAEIARTRRDRLRYAEVGGWAVAPHRQRTTDGLALALSAYALSRILGGSVGITTAEAERAAPILERIGGSRLRFCGLGLPAYFDPRYEATIQILRFDSRRPSPQYAMFVEHLERKLPSVQILCA